MLDGLEAGGHETVPVVVDREGAWRRIDPRSTGDTAGEPLAVVPDGGLLDVDVVFPVLHGPFGEDGAVQGLLESLDVPYVGAGVLGSAQCMDKAVFKRSMAHVGMPQVRHEVLFEYEWSSDHAGCLDRARAIGFPQFVKPARLGSSVGISKVSGADELEGALQLGFDHDPCVLAEAAAIGIEVECSVIGNNKPIASEPGQVIAQADWYDFEAKYGSGGMELIIPAPISDAQRERIRRIATGAFLSSLAAGLARVDFFVTEQGQVLLNELNTSPGFTTTSVFARLFEASGVPYVELLDRLLGYAIERHGRDRSFLC